MAHDLELLMTEWHMGISTGGGAVLMPRAGKIQRERSSLEVS